MTVSAHRGIYALLLTEQPTLQLMEIQNQVAIDEFSSIELQELLQQWSELFEDLQVYPQEGVMIIKFPSKDETQVVKWRLRLIIAVMSGN